MLKLIQRLLITALALFVLMFIYLSLAEACDRWVLEGSMITGSKYSSGIINLCYYQDLNGSGQTLKMRLPASKSCPIILDPCPEGGSKTEVTVNQKTETREPELSEAEYRRQWEKEYREFLRLNPDRK